MLHMFTLYLQQIYVTSYYWWVKSDVSIKSGLELVTTYHIGFIVKILLI